MGWGFDENGEPVATKEKRDQGRGIKRQGNGGQRGIVRGMIVNGMEEWGVWVVALLRHAAPRAAGGVPDRFMIMGKF